jgi:CRISPR system Cascade subunit CasE
MYLSRLILNLRSRAVRHDLADCQALHRTIMATFPDLPEQDGARARLGVLFRLDVHPRTGVPTVLVQSTKRPDWSRLPSEYLDPAADPTNPACKPVDEPLASIGSGTELVFRLRANPTRRIARESGPNAARWIGKRVELRDETSRVEWLRRKGEQGGFELLAVRQHSGVAPVIPDVRTAQESKLTGRRSTSGVGQRLTFGSVLFDGRLRVTDPARFRESLASGIGSGKAYGFGLLSIAPPGS